MAGTTCLLALGACGTTGGGPGPAATAPAPKTAAAAPLPSTAPAPATRPQPTAAKEVCVPRGLTKAPRYPDSDAALRDAGGAADRYQLMAAGRLLRMRRLAELEKAVDGCR